MSWTIPSWTDAVNAKRSLTLRDVAPLIADQPAGLSMRGEEAWLVGQLVARRAALGLSQEQLAARVGVDYAQLARWETLSWRPLPPNLVAWCQALGLRLALAPRGVEPVGLRQDGGGQNPRRKSRPEDAAQNFPASRRSA